MVLLDGQLPRLIAWQPPVLRSQQAPAMLASHSVGVQATLSWKSPMQESSCTKLQPPVVSQHAPLRQELGLQVPPKMKVSGAEQRVSKAMRQVRSGLQQTPLGTGQAGPEVQAPPTTQMLSAIVPQRASRETKHAPEGRQQAPGQGLGEQAPSIHTPVHAA